MPTTNFKNSSGTDIGNTLVEKSYLIDRYPELADTFKQAGLWAWGYNVNYQLGDGTTASKSSPVLVLSGGTNWTQVKSGYTHSAAIKTDGTLWTWGYDDYGQLGVNASAITRSTPVQTVAAGTTWKQVDCSWTTTTAIKTDGTLWLWGRNNYGQLGDGTTTNRSSPVQITGTTWKFVSVGQYNGAAIKTDGTLWSWGYNYYGLLGDATTTSRSSPVQIYGGGTNWKQVSVGHSNVGAIKSDGTLWMWGSQQYGVVGNGLTDGFNHVSTPVQTTSGGTNWKQVSAGIQGAAAIKTDGTLWLWGRNNVGQLGDGTTTNRVTPVQIAGTTWKEVVKGEYYRSAALKTDGTIWAWGWALYGGLGNNADHTINLSSPTQIFGGGTNWKLISVGNYFMTAIRDDSADIFGNNL
jgi:alpha-tubulin suppressor-like RCC1 family protein